MHRGVSCEHNCLWLESAAEEMRAIAAANVRVKNPVYHFSLSWPADESPTDEQAFECARYAMRALGFGGHQYVSAVHRDTDNSHVHVAVNRVHPETFRSVYPYRDHFTLDRAMRELEIKYGWKHDNGAYSVVERNGVPVVERTKPAPHAQERMPTGAKDMERHGDQESLHSYARGEPKKAVLKALKDPSLTWQKLHAVFAQYGLSLREKGQGLAVYDMHGDTDIPIKASAIHESLGKARLVKRLGEFEEVRQQRQEDEQQAVQHVQAEKAPSARQASRYNRYRSPGRDRAVREQRRQARAAARRELRIRYTEYKMSFVVRRLHPDDVRARFNAIYDDARRKKEQIKRAVADPAMRRLLYAAVSFDRMMEREALKSKIRKEREALRTAPTNRRQTYREWVAAQAMDGDDAAISQMRGWAYYEKRKKREALRMAIEVRQHSVIMASRASKEFGSDPIVVPLPGLHFSVRKDGTIAYRRDDNDRLALVDTGSFIELCDNKHATVQAAVTLAKARFSTVDLSGNDEFLGAIQPYLATPQVQEQKQEQNAQEQAPQPPPPKPPTWSPPRP